MALMVLALLVVGLWLYKHLERVTIESNSGFTGEARRNPFLAAQRFVEGLGMETEHVGNLFQHPEFPHPNDSLLFTRGLKELSRGRGERLLNWVRQGGHLLTVTQFVDDGDDVLGLNPVLEAVGIYGLLDDAAAIFENDIAIAVSFDGSERELRFSANPAKVLASRNEDVDFALGSDNADFILSAPLGEGRVTVLSESRLFRNSHIDQLDHAELLWRLLGLNGRDGRLWIISGVDMPPLYQWLWQHIPQFILLAGLLLLLWLWNRVQRFGPVLPSPPLTRRRILEHIAASGRFYWDHRLAGRLLELNRRRLWRVLLRRHPELQALRRASDRAGSANQRAREALYKRLQQITGVDADELQKLLEFSYPQDLKSTRVLPLRAETFTRHMQQIQSIRNRL